MAKILKNSKVILLVIIVLAAFLRLYKLTSIPVSLFGDELDLGYHAYSIAKTGKDYHGNFMPLHFQSLAEWRTPLYLYAAVPTVSIFGVTPLGVRLPAAIFGILSVWGIYLLTKEILSYGQKPTGFHPRALAASFLMAINPWHLQYSRAGFEVTMMLALLIFGLYFFFKALNKGKYLWISVILLLLTPLVYSTAKLFTPILLLFLVIYFKKEILSVSKKYLVTAGTVSLIVGGIVTYAVLFAGGGQRFNYISIFSDPVVEPEVGVARLNDARVRGEIGTGLTPTLQDRVLHNKFVYWSEKITNNIFSSLSFNFLFASGDPNPRHTPTGMGEFYKIDVLLLLAGIFFLLIDKRDFRIKLLLFVWILGGIVPAVITRDGGNHATRLIAILPPLIILMAIGFKNLSKYLKFVYLFFLALGVVFYLHNYYVHYPWSSERWWHTGWGGAISSVKEVENNYDKVIVTMSDEPAWIFFAGWYQYDPAKWQDNFPIGNDVELIGFGKVSHIDKYYFGSPSGGIYSLKDSLDEKSLYLASAKEIPWNLILEPGRTPEGLNLTKSIAFPSGEPAFYLFTKK